jgi:hypothetical protein
MKNVCGCVACSFAEAGVDDSGVGSRSGVMAAQLWCEAVGGLRANPLAEGRVSVPISTRLTFCSSVFETVYEASAGRAGAVPRSAERGRSEQRVRRARTLWALQRGWAACDARARNAAASGSPLLMSASSCV